MSVDYAVKYVTARARLLAAMQDLEWHGWRLFRHIGGVRYSARLLELKRLGYQIEDRDRPTGDGKDYRLISLVPTRPQGKQVKIYLPEIDVESLLRGYVSVNATKIASDALRIFRANRHKL